MIYQLRFDRRFMRQLESLPGDIRGLARRQVKSLAENPRPSRAKGHHAIFASF